MSDPTYLDYLFLRFLTYLKGLFAIIAGLLILDGGRERWSGPSYHDALSFPGAPSSWAYWLLLSGVAIFLGLFRHWHRFTATACFSIAVWCFMFTSTLITTANRDHHAGNLGPATFGALGMACVIVAVAQLLRRSSP